MQTSVEMHPIQALPGYLIRAEGPDTGRMIVVTVARGIGDAMRLARVWNAATGRAVSIG